MKKIIYILFLLPLLVSCTSKVASDDEDVFITQPTTNNPLIVPSYGRGLPGMPSQENVRF